MCSVSTRFQTKPEKPQGTAYGGPSTPPHLLRALDALKQGTVIENNLKGPPQLLHIAVLWEAKWG